MNKNLKFQTAQPIPTHPEAEPSQEQIITAIRLKNLRDSKGFQTLESSLQDSINELSEIAFNSAKPQPARINALEQITGIKMVLGFPSEYAQTVDNMLKPYGKSLDDYMDKIKQNSIELEF